MRIRTIAILTATAGLCLSMTSLPESHAQPTATRPSPGEAPRSATGGTFDLNFPGGTVGEYLDSVTQITTVNIVAPEEVRSLVMPAVRLRGVSAGASVELVKNMFIDSASTGAVQLGLVEGESTAPIYVLSVVFRDGRRSDPAPPSVNEIFSVGDVLRPASDEPTDLQVKKIFEMIDSAMTLAPAEVAPELAFHDDTQMLVFRGSPEQRRLIESVLERYHQSWRASSELARQLREGAAATQLEAQTSAIEADAAESRTKHLMDRVAELRELVEAGGVSSSELRDAVEEANQAGQQSQIARARAEHARAQADVFTRRLTTLNASDESTLVIYDFRGLGAEGDRVGIAFKGFLDAARFPQTEMNADGAGMVTLRARPALHETMHYLLHHLRAQAAASRPPSGTR